MKKILFPALAALLTVASSTAFAQSGSWYVIHDESTQDCFAAHHIGVGGEETTLGGPLPSQAAALSAISSIAACGGGSRGAM